MGICSYNSGRSPLSLLSPQTSVNTRYINQERPVNFDIPVHQSLQSKSITFKSTSDRSGADWARVTLEDGIRIIGKKEVYIDLFGLFLLFFFDI